MAASQPSYHLWIATDDTKTVAALTPLQMSSLSLRYQWGSITDLRAVPVAEKPTNVAGVVVLCTAVALGFIGLLLNGAPLLAVAIPAALVLFVASVNIMSRPSAARVKAPSRSVLPDLYRILETEERQEFLDLVELAKQAGETLPAVENLIDPSEGGELLAQVLWEAADVLSRRRDLRPRVADRTHAPAPADAPASLAAQLLSQQRETVKVLRDQTETELSRIRTALELAALAGENAEHDPSAGEAVREAYRELADLYGEKT